ncbi:serine-threonine protein kinase [Streptomyces sp. NBC_00536]|uniref:serine-threonine protein kinase n=1 Tax=Streptomyces sp. NBC_00536 TaxID=2975769 RepID=UPI002E7FF454|nr:serine-threonine protein kinase [Streptomyces sp. NBC_00536]WUC83622.1 serine-threonine protein kinase [Streptomyces sp. NBC_00536]
MSDAGVSGAGAAGVRVRPYVELTFDADGDVDPATRDAVARLDVTDLLVFAHGWNSDRTAATQLYDSFFAPFPGLLAPGVRPGYVGVVWPSMIFSDEPIPDFGHQGAVGVGDAVAETGYAVRLDARTRQALGEFWPGREAELDRVAELLEQQPESAAALVEFGALIRELSGTDTAVGAGAAAPGRVPLMFTEDVLEVCRAFTDALAETGALGGALDGAPPVPGAQGFSVGSAAHSLWNGAKELLRQATYYRMKKRAGVIGEHGLGPVLAGLARPSGGGSGPRVHLIGHSFGARVVSFALRGLPEAGPRGVRSVTLLQGAFSHYAFAARLPFGLGAGDLHGLPSRVDGPVVACHSDFDTALKVLYPLASRLAGDATGFAGFDSRWGAVGHDGIQEVAGAPRLTLDAALRGGLPAAGCVSVDAASVVRRGGAPSGAHSDICHEELARLVTLAGRVGR